MNPLTVSLDEIIPFRESVYQLFSRCLLQAPSTELRSLFENPEWRESACVLLGTESEDLYRDLAREADVERLAACGVHAVLIGTTLMKAGDALHKVMRPLTGVYRPGFGP